MNCPLLMLFIYGMLAFSRLLLLISFVQNILHSAFTAYILILLLFLA